jgi:hypothetical protein
MRYGVNADTLTILRAGFPAPTHNAEALTSGHGFEITDEAGVVAWFAQYSVNREPDTLSLAADEDDDYYWNHVSLSRALTFGRWGAFRNVNTRDLYVNLVRNIDTIDVNISQFGLHLDDVIHGNWHQRDPLVPHTVIALHPIGGITSVTTPSGLHQFTVINSIGYITLGNDSLYNVHVIPDAVEPRHGSPLPDSPRLVSAFPNPFNSTTTFVFESPKAISTSLEIYSILGEKASVIPLSVGAGNTRIVFEGRGLSSGTYFAKLHGQTSKPIQITLIK